MSWLRNIKNVLFSQSETRPTSDHELIHKSNNEKADPIPYSVIYDTIDKYYKSKNGSYQFAIGIVCHSTNNVITDSIITKEINRLSTCINDPDFSFDDKARFKNMATFYEDIMRFRDYFSVKGTKLSVNDILNIFKEVQQKNVKASNQKHEDEIFDIMKSKVNDQDSEHDIIRKFIIYTAEKSDIDMLSARCMADLPDLLSRFGFKYYTYAPELNEKVIQVLRELDAEAFSSNIESSYDETHEDHTSSDRESMKYTKRNNISSETKREVWRRDQGKCSKCESRDNLEYDHIIPVSKGGSNTARNIELLCQECNRKKSNNIL